MYVYIAANLQSIWFISVRHINKYDNCNPAGSGRVVVYYNGGCI